MTLQCSEPEGYAINPFNVQARYDGEQFEAANQQPATNIRPCTRSLLLDDK